MLKEDIPFPTSTALDDLELFQPLNQNKIDFAKARRADPWLSELINYISSGKNSLLFVICHLSSKVKNRAINVSKHCKLEDGFFTIMMKILYIFVYLFQKIPTYNVIC